MSDVQTNYLINTAPELQQPFIDALKKTKHFSNLSDEHLSQIFKYSNFQVLKDGERPIQEGTFGQQVYMLIQGRLEVFLTNEIGKEEYVDVLYTPFRMFGEQCILGEAYNASVEARGDVLLLSIDISPLPDLLEGLDDVGRRLEDAEYRQNTDIFMIFADVLNNRLNRLIKDQYKLLQKIVILHQSEEYQTSWKQNVLLTTLFNEFSLNQLSTNLNLKEILQSTLEEYLSQNDRLKQLLAEEPIDTQSVYLELVKLDAMDEFVSMSSLLMEIIQKLSANAMTLPEYTESLEFKLHDLPAIIPLAEYLEELYDSIIDAGLFKEVPLKETFIDSFLVSSHPDPFALHQFLSSNDLVENEFNMAHLMFLICQKCIEKELQLNQIISGSVKYLNDISAPRQNTRAFRIENQEANAAIVSDLIKLQKSTVSTEEETVKERPTTSAKQANVEDLLSEFGL